MWWIVPAIFRDVMVVPNRTLHVDVDISEPCVVITLVVTEIGSRTTTSTVQMTAELTGIQGCQQTIGPLVHHCRIEKRGVVKVRSA